MPEDILAKPSPTVPVTTYSNPSKNRPDGWSSKSNVPYYRKEFAEWIKQDIDRMIEKNGRLMYDYATFCSSYGISKNTLYNKISQAIRYLEDKMDTPDRKYLRWHQSVKIQRNRYGKGVTIQFKLESHSATVESPPAEQVYTMPEWKVEMEDWLESVNKVPFVKEGLMLNDNDVMELKEQLGELKNILPSIKNNSIKIIKL